MDDEDDEDDEITNLRIALALALFALDLVAKEVIRPADAALTLKVIEEKYGFTTRNT